MQLSEHVTLAEVTKNKTATLNGLDNTPTPEHLENLKKVLENIFEPLRKGRGGNPIYISCGYRGAAVNAKTKGASKTSFHCTGHALDLDADVFGKMTNKDIFYYIKDNLNYSELIWEHGTKENPDWVHVAFAEGDSSKETLRAYIVMDEKGKPKTKYVNFDL
jgi:putative chitinase